MKKFFVLAAAAALTLASCAKVEHFSKVNDEQHVIGFSNYAPRALAKADVANYVDTTVLVSGADFDVWGWYTANGVSFDGTNGTPYFGNSNKWYTVTYRDGGDTLGTKNAYPDGARYWPTGDTPDYLHFYAYYPSNAGQIDPAAGLGAFTFIAESKDSTQVDFMIADLVKNQTYDNSNGNPGTNSGTDGTVALKFRHQLTKVQVKFKTTPAIVKDALTDITVTGAKFYNIRNTGTLTTSYDGTTFATAWDPTSVTGTDSLEIAYPKTALDSLASTVANKNFFLMVPQAMQPKAGTNPQYIEVSWKVVTDGVTTNNTRKIYLDECVDTDGGSTQADIDWEKNRFVTYIITIAPNQILFTGSAYKWEDEEFGYYNIF